MLEILQSLRVLQQLSCKGSVTPVGELSKILFFLEIIQEFCFVCNKEMKKSLGWVSSFLLAKGISVFLYLWQEYSDCIIPVNVKIARDTRDKISYAGAGGGGRGVAVFQRLAYNLKPLA